MITKQGREIAVGYAGQELCPSPALHKAGLILSTGTELQSRAEGIRFQKFTSKASWSQTLNTCMAMTWSCFTTKTFPL